MSLIPHSNIRVDNFCFMRNDLTQYIFFLSHCHEDHVKGLNPSWNYGKIYTSKISKILIVDRFPNLKDLVVELEMDEEHWIYLDDQQQEGVSVMLMDAYHCPGAVMFLFKGKMGNVFHTEYDFPTREEAYNQLKDTIKAHAQHRIFLFSYHLGKEEVFVNLANDFETLVVVDEDRFRKLCIMDLSIDLFTTDSTMGWIHIKSIKDLKNFDIQESNKEEPTVFIILTGWNDKYNRNLPFYFKIPYSSHSNYRELERLVKSIMPKNLVFNVPERAMSEKRLNFQRHLISQYVVKGKKDKVDAKMFNPKKGYICGSAKKADIKCESIDLIKSEIDIFQQSSQPQSKDAIVGYKHGDNYLSESQDQLMVKKEEDQTETKLKTLKNSEEFKLDSIIKGESDQTKQLKNEFKIKREEFNDKTPDYNIKQEQTDDYCIKDENQNKSTKKSRTKEKLFKKQKKDKKKNKKHKKMIEKLKKQMFSRSDEQILQYSEDFEGTPSYEAEDLIGKDIDLKKEDEIDNMVDNLISHPVLDCSSELTLKAESLDINSLTKFEEQGQSNVEVLPPSNVRKLEGIDKFKIVYMPRDSMFNYLRERYLANKAQQYPTEILSQEQS
ncbi:5 exonuclease apollo [Stylonychia lemnae]|uniref:Protein artemis n=1 Tax=Stylonychia lemnae TaxID=5949 RepID=A0A078ATG1_STYLE|nr:5 exonuclease apollo [Stylonychia lemnae]|eukprot:CDW85730.1 5 exonuclease apollo [Stylonychia lemnae]